MKSNERKLLQVQNCILKALDKIRELPEDIQEELSSEYRNNTQNSLVWAERNIWDQIEIEANK